MTSRRKSLSSSWAGSEVQHNVISPQPPEAEEWTKAWKTVLARDLIDERIVFVDAETTVEDACDTLLSENILCLVVKSQAMDLNHPTFQGLFDFSDVNAFLTLAATSHTLLPVDLEDKSPSKEIVSAARAGHVPVRLVSNFSGKNPLEILPNNATLLSLLELFSCGTHRALIRAARPSNAYVGIVSDRGLLSWFATHANENPALRSYISSSLRSFSLPSLYIFDAVISATSHSTVLDAMRLMSEEGVSSIAIVEEESGTLLSAVSVTDIGKIVVPSQSKQILSIPLHQFISQIKNTQDTDGFMDGADTYPVYSVSPSSSLAYTIDKLLATNAHRLFVTGERTPSSPIMSSTSHDALSGIMSIVDILSLFARLANIADIDPTRMKRDRRLSSSSSQSSTSDRELFLRSLSRSRSGSAASIQRSSSMILAPVATGPYGTRHSISELDSLRFAHQTML